MHCSNLFHKRLIAAVTLCAAIGLLGTSSDIQAQAVAATSSIHLPLLSNHRVPQVVFTCTEASSTRIGEGLAAARVLYSVPLIGGQATRSSGANGNDFQWTPDGNTLSFGSGPEYWQAERDGSNARKLFDGAEYAQISPDGKQVAYFAPLDRNGSIEQPRRLFLANTDGTNIRQVPAEAPGLSSALWSPDSTTLAFFVNTSEQALSLLNVADGTVKKVATPGLLLASPVAWSPDGTKLVVHASDVPTQTKSLPWLVAIDGSGQKQLYGPASSSAVAYTSNFSWSADGTSLFFVGWQGTQTELLRSNASGTKVEWLRQATISDSEQLVVANASQFLFLAKGALHLLPEGSTWPRALNRPSEAVGDFALTQDQRTVVYVANDNGNSYVVAMNLDGSGAQTLYAEESAQVSSNCFAVAVSPF